MRTDSENYTRTRVSKDILKSFQDLVVSRAGNSKKAGSIRENVDKALLFFIENQMLPEEMEPISAQLKKETGRYISFFRVAEKNIYERLENMQKTVLSSKQGSSTVGFTGEISEIGKSLELIFQSIRLGYSLNFRIMEYLFEDDELFKEVFEDFKSKLSIIEKARK